MKNDSFGNAQLDKRLIIERNFLKQLKFSNA